MVFFITKKSNSLEIITPIRGRKLAGLLAGTGLNVSFRNNNPDKWTDTMSLNYPPLYLLLYV